MKWGLEKADAMGLDSFVEATVAGYEMYKAAGFITFNDIWADAKTGSSVGLYRCICSYVNT